MSHYSVATKHNISSQYFKHDCNISQTHEYHIEYEKLQSDKREECSYIDIKIISSHNVIVMKHETACLVTGAGRIDKPALPLSRTRISSALRALSF